LAVGAFLSASVSTSTGTTFGPALASATSVSIRTFQTGSWSSERLAPLLFAGCFHTDASLASASRAVFSGFSSAHAGRAKEGFKARISKARVAVFMTEFLGGRSLQRHGTWRDRLAAPPPP